MENNNSNLSSIFLVFAIIVIFIMGAYIYTYKTESTNQISELQSNTIQMQKTINVLQSKIDAISNIINSNTTIDNTPYEKNNITNNAPYEVTNNINQNTSSNTTSEKNRHSEFTNELEGNNI